MQLTEKEKRVIDLRYGLSDGHPRRLSEIARILHFSRQHVWEVELQAIRKLSLRYGFSQTDIHFPKLSGSALLRLRGTLSSQERLMLKERWIAGEANGRTDTNDRERSVYSKALAMV